MTGEVLTVAEIEEITGYKHAKRQHQWFRDNGFRATLNACNRCIVFRADLQQREVERPKVQLRRAA